MKSKSMTLISPTSDQGWVPAQHRCKGFTYLHGRLHRDVGRFCKGRILTLWRETRSVQLTLNSRTTSYHEYVDISNQNGVQEGPRVTKEHCRGSFLWLLLALCIGIYASVNQGWHRVSVDRMRAAISKQAADYFLIQNQHYLIDKARHSNTLKFTL